MVEANAAGKTQLPNPKSVDEEVKVDMDEKKFMYGSLEEFTKDFWSRIGQVQINPLEQGLLSKLLEQPEENCEKIVDTLNKIKEKQDVYAAKRIGKLIPLFDKHDFWFTQPVPKYFEPVALSEYDKPVEVKTLSEVQKEPYALPAGYYWSAVNLNDESELNEVYELLKNHYVEDTDGKFRFDYSTKFLSWALNPPDSHIMAAYAFYNFSKDNETERMKQLIRDLLIMAKSENFDVFNMTEVLQHGCIGTDLMFKPGDGRLAHYFYNWRIQSIKASDIGIVLV